MSINRFIKTLLLPCALAATFGAGLAHGQVKKLIPVTPSTNPSRPADSITTNLTLSKDTTWILKGFVLVKTGVTLTIEPGTTIEGDPTVKGTLLVDRGGYLIAAGTKEAPITFKGPTENRGEWGGIVLLGKAISNQSFQGSLIQYEAMAWARYAGTDDNDSSGVLTYLRLTNPGFPVAQDRELNGLTLCAVGRKTVIHHIQVHRGDDDGIEWFGGTVNTAHLVVTNTVDDSYDTDHGYSGHSQYMIAIQTTEPARPRPGTTLPFETVGDRGLECGSSSGGGLIPKTHPAWRNVTLIDNGLSGGPFEAKEECGGKYEKMVLVTGATADSSSDWAINLPDQVSTLGVIDPVPHLEFSKTYITGKWDKLYNIAGTASQIALATDLLNAGIKNIPYASITSYGLHKDLSPSHAGIKADEAGAIVGKDLWYKDWTFPGTVVFEYGDVPVNAEAPTVTLTRAPGYLTAPATFTLNATATDVDGIALLEILRDGTVLASSPTGALSHPITNADAGTHTYTVRAIDGHSTPMTATGTLSVTVNPPNTPPAVTLTSNSPSVLVAPATFTLTASAADPHGIGSLEIRLKGSSTPLKTGTTGNLVLEIANLAAGTYTYSAKAVDSHSETPLTTTQELLVIVEEPVPNNAPTVVLTRPNATLLAPAAFTLNATASDPDGIDSLWILEGDEVVGRTADSTLSVALADKGAGTYTYTAKTLDKHATDPKTATFDLTVVVHAPPQDTLNAEGPAVTLSLVGNDLVAPAAFKLLATAEDPNDIDTLQILLDGEVVAAGNGRTLEFEVTGKGAGTYNYTARAKDKHPSDPKVSTAAKEVVVAAPPANVAPAVAFTRSGSETLHAGEAFTLHIVATDPENLGIDTVQILLDDVVLATSTNGVFSFQVSGLAAGTYTYMARVKDRHGVDPKVTLVELEVEIQAPTSIAIGAPLRDLAGLRVSGSGQALRVDSEGQGKVMISVWALSGRRIQSRQVNLVQGRNLIPMGSLHGVHIVRFSDGVKSRSARVVFNPGN